METFFLVFRILAYSIGVVNLTVLFLFHRVYRVRTVSLSLLLMLPLTTILVGETMLVYYRMNTQSLQLYYSGRVVIYISMGVLVYILPAFGLKMRGHTLDVRYHVPVTALAVMTTGVGVVSLFFPLPWFISEISFLILTVAILAAVLLGLYPLRRVPAHNVDDAGRVALKIAKSMLVFLPLLIVFDFFPEAIPVLRGAIPRSVSVLPVVYLYWNGALLAVFFSGMQESGNVRGAQPRFMANPYHLSEREQQVLHELLRGRTYADIADALCISVATVKTHANRIYKKSRCRNRSELMARLL